MILNHENPANISYVSVYSDPERDTQVVEHEEGRLIHYCNCLEVAVLVCEVLTAASLALCAFLI